MRLHSTLCFKMFLAALASITSISLSGARVSAQTRVMPPDPYDSQQSAAAASSNSPTNSGPPARPASSNVTDYPAAEVQAVPVAMAQVAQARAEFDRAETNIRLIVDRLKEDFEYSSQVLTAMHTQQVAYEGYTAARNTVLGRLASQTDYQTLKHLRDDLGKTLNYLQDDPTRNHDRIAATAAVKMQYGCKISDMESDALKADAAVQSAKAQFVDASDRLTQMRAAFARSIRRDSTFVAARNQLEDAKIGRDTTLAFLSGAIEARNIAMNYAYDLHRWDQYKYLSAGGYEFNNPYGYGYGATYGYAVPSLVYNPINYYRQQPFVR